MGKVDRQWQAVRGVLEHCGGRIGTARRRYKVFVEKGVLKGRCPELVVGGLIRSSGGWEAVKAMRRAKVFEKSDERILGDGDFVETVLAASNEQMKRKYHLRAQGVDIETIAARVSELTGVEKSQIFLPGKEENRGAVRELGMSMSELSGRLELSLAGVSQSVKRCENDADFQDFLGIIDSSGITCQSLETTGTPSTT
jgi:hypothetical protein